MLDFEQWVYDSDFLKKEMQEDDYLYLISLNYQTTQSFYNLEKILVKYIDYGKLETIKMNALLDSIINKDNNAANSIIRIYQLSCDGYSFLSDLGLSCGLRLTVPDTGSNLRWEQLMPQQKQKLTDQQYPKARELAVIIKKWIEEKEIILTGKQDDNFGRWDFIDNRKEKDNYYSRNSGQEVNNFNNPINKWWQIWK